MANFPVSLRNARSASRKVGFTLLELLIVVTVLGVICAIAMPGYQVAKKVSNEGAVISEMRTLHTAGEMYRLQQGTYGTIPDLVAARLLLDSFLDTRHGYEFENTGVTNTTRWSVVASPVTLGQTGDRFFYIDNSGVIRATNTPPPDDGSSPID